jgi:hypothetical protein
MTDRFKIITFAQKKIVVSHQEEDLLELYSLIENCPTALNVLSTVDCKRAAFLFRGNLQTVVLGFKVDVLKKKRLTYRTQKFTPYM